MDNFARLMSAVCRFKDASSDAFAGAELRGRQDNQSAFRMTNQREEKYLDDLIDLAREGLADGCVWQPLHRPFCRDWHPCQWGCAYSVAGGLFNLFLDRVNERLRWVDWIARRSQAQSAGGLVCWKSSDNNWIERMICTRR